jgi:hypothetical protein
MPLPLALAAAQGVIVGMATAWAVRRHQLAAPGAATAVAATAAIAAVIGQLALDWRAAWRARSLRSTELRDALLASGLGSEAELEAEHRDRSARPDFGGYVAHHFGAGDDPFPDEDSTGALRGPAAAAAALVELAIAGLIAAAIARPSAREPACARCGRWRVEHPIGRAPLGTAAGVTRHLLAGDTSAAAALLAPPDTREETRLALLTCRDGHDGDGGVLRLCEERIDRRRRVAVHRVADLVVTGDELAVLRARLGDAGTT